MTNSGNERAGAAVAPLMELTIIAGIELEKARAKLPFDVEPVRWLGAALARASSPSVGEPPITYVEPGYLRPFRRLYLLERDGEHPAASEVKDHMARIAERFESFADRAPKPSEADKLVDVCIGLHRALRDELRQQETTTGHEWSAFNIATKDSRVTA